MPMGLNHLLQELRFHPRSLLKRPSYSNNMPAIIFFGIFINCSFGNLYYILHNCAKPCNFFQETKNKQLCLVTRAI